MFRILAVCALGALLGCGGHLSESARRSSCTRLAIHAGVQNAILTMGAVEKLAVRAIKDHGAAPPTMHRDGYWVIHHVTQADIQAAADELKPCFPEK